MKVEHRYEARITLQGNEIENLRLFIESISKEFVRKNCENHEEVDKMLDELHSQL